MKNVLKLFLLLFLINNLSHVNAMSNTKEPKKLKNWMTAVDWGIYFRPIIMVNAYLTKNVASKILNEIKEENLLEIKINLDELVTNLMKFSSDIGKAPSIAQSLAKESLDNPGSALTQFFHSKQALKNEENTRSFFNQRIKDINDLKAMCIEFITFYNDLKLSLSKGTIKSFHDELKKKNKEA